MSRQVVKRSPEEWLELVERITKEGPLSLPKAARLVKANSKSGHASVNTLMRWIINGRRGVFLEGCRLNGQQWSTSGDAIKRFQAAQSAARISQVLGRSKEPELKTDTGETKTQRALERVKSLKPKRR